MTKVVDDKLNQIAKDIYDPRIETCSAEYRQAMTKFYIKLALEEGLRLGIKQGRLLNQHCQ